MKTILVVMSILSGISNASLIEYTNVLCNPISVGFGGSEVGWLYSSKSSNAYYLNQVQTIFSEPVIYDPAAWEVNVLMEIYDQAPIDGGVLLRQISFVPQPDTFIGPTFDPLLIHPGDSIFIGLRNVETITANLLDEGPDVLVTYANFQPTSEGTYSEHWAGGSCPVLLFFGDPVPEPASFLLLGMGAILSYRHNRGRNKCS